MNKKEPMLSVIVPVYNTEQYIEECTESILKQTYMDIEIILVDDGSSDQSGALCDLIAERNDCVRTLHMKHAGILKARYAGVKISKGKWITFVDSDDWISENAYRDLIEDNDCDVVSTDICRYIDSDHQIVQATCFREGVYSKEDIIAEIIPVMLWKPELRRWALDPSLCTKIFRKRIILEQIEKALDVGSDYGEDSVVIFPMMFRINKIQITKRVYYYHRQRLSGVISPYIADDNFITKLYAVYEYLKKEFRNTAYWYIMKNQLECFFINAVEAKKRCYEYPILEFSVYFPFDRIPPKSKVVMYGAGYVGKQYWKQNSLYKFCDIISWVDSQYKKSKTDNNIIENPAVIKEKKFDYILVAVDDYYIAKEIVFSLAQMGIKQKNIVWHSVRVDRRAFEEIFDASEKGKV